MRLLQIVTVLGTFGVFEVWTVASVIVCAFDATLVELLLVIVEVVTITLRSSSVDFCDAVKSFQEPTTSISFATAPGFCFPGVASLDSTIELFGITSGATVCKFDCNKILSILGTFAGKSLVFSPGNSLNQSLVFLSPRP